MSSIKSRLARVEKTTRQMDEQALEAARKSVPREVAARFKALMEMNAVVEKDCGLALPIERLRTIILAGFPAALHEIVLRELPAANLGTVKGSPLLFEGGIDGEARREARARWAALSEFNQIVPEGSRLTDERMRDVLLSQFQAQWHATATSVVEQS